MAKEIFVTEFDKERLVELLEEQTRRVGTGDKSLQGLERELMRAKVVAAKGISPDIITMNSRALLKIDDDPMEVALVYPDDADAGEGSLSVLSPIGTAILGCRKGDLVEWEVPSGTTAIRIEDVLYQPEAAGDEQA